MLLLQFMVRDLDTGSTHGVVDEMTVRDLDRGVAYTVADPSCLAEVVNAVPSDVIVQAADVSLELARLDPILTSSPHRASATIPTSSVTDAVVGSPAFHDSAPIELPLSSPFKEIGRAHV